jgi:hypothetical protein
MSDIDELCRGCSCYFYPGTEICPHCGADVAEAHAADHMQAARRATSALNELPVHL